ncbi:hypothetical protein [Flavobacterium sp. 83]|uniref:hypothetical protein n=1 Tax=Flavobacterium sp. 83 TaxID=1131812 RepID=UPI0005512B27|nr:hypothetical protein [Flavobacterium sp. 83]
MDNFKSRVSNEPKQFSGIAIVLLILLLSLLFWVIYEFKDENRFAVVKFNGKGSTSNLSKNYSLVQFPSNEKNYGAVLAEKGDVLGFNDLTISFSNVTNDSLQIDDSGDSLVFVNGKVNTIILTEKANLIPWFQKMKCRTIDNLETLYFKSKIPRNYIPYLKKIAELKPNIALTFEENDSLILIENYFKTADFFKPQFIRASLKQNQLSLLSHWKTTECLHLTISDSIVTATLPAMPALKQCIINGGDIKSMNVAFFKNNPQLEKISLFACLTNYSVLQPLKNLKQLVITNFGCTGDLATLKNKFPKLSVLIASGIFTNIDALSTCQNIKWLGLPENTSQKQFDTICTKLSSLQILEIKGNDAVKKVSVLQKLPNLRGLVITDTVTDRQSLHALKQLRYLSIPEKNKVDSTYVQTLKKSLPGCIIVPNTGACMGSGWLLLLVPTVFLFSLVFPRKLLKKSFKRNKKNGTFRTNKNDSQTNQKSSA